jgi:hypothetical protein
MGKIGRKTKGIFGQKKQKNGSMIIAKEKVK